MTHSARDCNRTVSQTGTLRRPGSVYPPQLHVSEFRGRELAATDLSPAWTTGGRIGGAGSNPGGRTLILDAMSTKRQTHLRTETYCLVRALRPMSKDDDRRFAEKIVAIMLVGTWLLITVLLSVEAIDAVAPPYYGVFTALVFLLVGKLWSLEVSEILPTGGS